MAKVIVIGCSGAGKSTFSRKLRDATATPLYHLDLLWHKQDKSTVTKEIFVKRLTNLLKKQEWIIDGTYLETLDIRIKACDTVIFLNYPLEVCLTGAATRIGKAREDMPWIETEFDPTFEQWIRDFPKNQLPIINQVLRENQTDKTILIFNSRTEADNFLFNLTNKIVSTDT